MFDFLKNLVSANNPKFGLYITDNCIQAIKPGTDKKNPKIEVVGQKQLPEGLVINGEIFKQKDLASEIKKLLTELKPTINETKCIVSIPEKQIYEYIFYLPGNLKGKSFKSGLEKLIRETIPIPFHEIKYDYSSFKIANINVVYVVSVRREIIAQYYEVLKMFCGLNPVILEPESLSLIRNIPLNLLKDEGRIIIDINNKKVSWFILWQSSIYDSNSIILNNLESDSIQEIVKSSQSFLNSTKRNIVDIIFLGNSSVDQKLSMEIQNATNIPARKLDKLRLTNATEYKVLGGLGLKCMGFDINTKINLLKKNIV